MTAAITIRFDHHDDAWRILCQASSGQCFLWRNGNFVRSATYVPGSGLKGAEGLGAGVLPKMLSGLRPHERVIAELQNLAHS